MATDVHPNHRPPWGGRKSNTRRMAWQKRKRASRSRKSWKAPNRLCVPLDSFGIRRQNTKFGSRFERLAASRAPAVCFLAPAWVHEGLGPRHHPERIGGYRVALSLNDDRSSHVVIRLCLGTRCRHTLHRYVLVLGDVCDSAGRLEASRLIIYRSWAWEVGACAALGIATRRHPRIRRIRALLAIVTKPVSKQGKENPKEHIVLSYRNFGTGQSNEPR